MKKVLFIDINRKPYLPEECLYTASLIKDEIGAENIFIVKMWADCDFETVEKVMESIGPEDQLSVHAWLYDYFPEDVHVTILEDLAKRFSSRPNTTFTLSGGHPTLAPEMFRKSGDFDYVIAGWPWAAPFKWLEGKPEQPEIIEALPLKDVPEEASFEKALDLIVNLDRCVWRDYGTEYVNFTFTRVCKYNCMFCMCTQFHRNFGGEVIKSEQRVLDELRFLKDRFKLTCITLTDFRNTAEQIQTIIDHDLKLVDQLDVCVRDLDEHFIDVLNAGGVECVFFGLESIRPDVQKKIGKRYDLERFSEILNYALKSGIMFEGNQMVGLSSVADGPVGVDDMLREVGAMAGYWEKHPNLRVMFRPYMPFLGTTLGDKIWGDKLDKMHWKEYLMLVYTVTSGLKLQEGQPLPPVYRDEAVYNKIQACYVDFDAMARHLTSLVLYPPKNPKKQEACETLTEYCFDCLKRGQFGFGGFLRKILASIGHWR